MERSETSLQELSFVVCSNTPQVHGLLQVQKKTFQNVLNNVTNCKINLALCFV